MSRRGSHNVDFYLDPKKEPKPVSMRYDEMTSKLISSYLDRYSYHDERLYHHSRSQWRNHDACASFTTKLCVCVIRRHPTLKVRLFPRIAKNRLSPPYIETGTQPRLPTSCQQRGDPVRRVEHQMYSLMFLLVVYPSKRFCRLLFYPVSLCHANMDFLLSLYTRPKPSYPRYLANEYAKNDVFL